MASLARIDSSNALVALAKGAELLQEFSDNANEIAKNTKPEDYRKEVMEAHPRKLHVKHLSVEETARNTKTVGDYALAGWEIGTVTGFGVTAFSGPAAPITWIAIPVGGGVGAGIGACVGLWKVEKRIDDLYSQWVDEQVKKGKPGNVADFKQLIKLADEFQPYLCSSTFELMMEPLRCTCTAKPIHFFETSTIRKHLKDKQDARAHEIEKERDKSEKAKQYKPYPSVYHCPCPKTDIVFDTRTLVMDYEVIGKVHSLLERIVAQNLNSIKNLTEVTREALICFKVEQHGIVKSILRKEMQHCSRMAQQNPGHIEYWSMRHIVVASKLLDLKPEQIQVDERGDDPESLKEDSKENDINYPAPVPKESSSRTCSGGDSSCVVM